MVRREIAQADIKHKANYLVIPLIEREKKKERAT